MLNNDDTSQPGDILLVGQFDEPSKPVKNRNLPKLVLILVGFIALLD